MTADRVFHKSNPFHNKDFIRMFSNTFNITSQNVDLVSSCILSVALKLPLPMNCFNK